MQINTHPTISYKKERTGWGKWSIVYTRKCIETGKLFRIIKNWHGGVPVGGFICSHCGKIANIGG
jgi:hypothetical protein